MKNAITGDVPYCRLPSSFQEEEEDFNNTTATAFVRHKQ